MITSFLFSIGFAIINFIKELFPISTGFPPAFNDSVAQISGYAGIIDSLVPVQTLLTVLTIVFSVEIAIFVFKFFRFIFGYVPLIGGKG